MVLTDTFKAGQNTADNQNPIDNVNPVLLRHSETLKLGGPHKINTVIEGNAWIVGSSTNGIVGTNTGTEGGGQQVVGGSGRVTTVVRVVSANNKFHEFFTTTQLIDTTNTTATQIIADGKVIF